MRLAMFGVTGTCGAPVLAAALKAGHEVRVLARAPQKLGYFPRLSVTEGDALDPAAVATTVEGADAVISTLGGFPASSRGRQPATTDSACCGWGRGAMSPPAM